MDPTDQVAPRRYIAIQRDDDGSTRTLGQVALDAECHITVISTEPDGADSLGKIMTRMNNKPVLHVDMPPPVGAPRFALASRLVQRGDPEFQTQLEAQLSQYYDIELRPL
jgi:hypothetical protein